MKRRTLLAVASLGLMASCTVRVPFSLVTSTRPFAGDISLGPRVRAEQCYSDFLGFPTDDVDLSIDAAMDQIQHEAPDAAGFVDVRIDLTHGWVFWPLSSKHCTRVSARPAFMIAPEAGPAPAPVVRVRTADKPARAAAADLAFDQPPLATHAVARPDPVCTMTYEAAEGPTGFRKTFKQPSPSTLKAGTMVRVERHETRGGKWMTLVETVDSLTAWVDSSCLEFR